MRKLASIQKIRTVEPIEGADAIEKASVLGWQLVIKKGEFKPGDLVVYVEIDALLPERPEFAFLKPRGMRIRTVKLRGQVSQGICFPLSILPEHFEIHEDADCTEVLGVTKYEPPIPACLNGIAKGKFPSFIPKTDEIRVQVLQKELDFLKGESCYITEKLDGSSVTYFYKDGDFGVCSRNFELVEDDENSYWKVARELKLEQKLQSLGKNIALQGELIGEGIQSNKLKLRGQSVRFFNVYDIDFGRYLSFDEWIDFLKMLDLTSVPIIETEYALENDSDALVAKAIRKSALNKDIWAEGIVIRLHKENLFHEVLNEHFRHGRVSFKAINPEFLVKYGE